MKLELNDNQGNQLKIGDSVEIANITDDSCSAVDMYGVEPHLDGWIESVYLEIIKGKIEFCKERLMYQIRVNKYKAFPLSPELRFDTIEQKFERLKEGDICEFSEEIKVSREKIDPEFVVDYLLKL